MIHAPLPWLAWGSILIAAPLMGIAVVAGVARFITAWLPLIRYCYIAAEIVTVVAFTLTVLYFMDGEVFRGIITLVETGMALAIFTSRSYAVAMSWRRAGE